MCFHSQTPSSETEWKKVAETFQKWNFPHCVGAIDGKHVVINAPPNSGSIYYNYKNTQSIVLMAICDGDYKFIYVDVGCNGRISDGGVFRKCSFTDAFESGALHLPEPQPLPGTNVSVPFTVVADDAFSLKPNMMKPYATRNLSASQRIFNYRLSRARRCIENAFGIMAGRFRVLRTPILLDAGTRKITLACCALHNFLLTNNANAYAPSSFADQYLDDGTTIEGSWRRESPENTFFSLENTGHRYHDNANKIRQEIEAYFMTVEEEVPWQYKHI